MPDLLLLRDVAQVARQGRQRGMRRKSKRLATGEDRRQGTRLRIRGGPAEHTRGWTAPQCFEQGAWKARGREHVHSSIQRRPSSGAWNRCERERSISSRMCRRRRVFGGRVDLDHIEALLR